MSSIKRLGNRIAVFTLFFMIGLDEETAMFKQMTSGDKKDSKWSVFFSLTAMLLASSLLLSACNTFEGMGEDVEAAGDEVEDATD